MQLNQQGLYKNCAPIPPHRNVAMYVPHQAGRVKEESRLLYLGGEGAGVTVYTALNTCTVFFVK